MKIKNVLAAGAIMLATAFVTVAPVSAVTCPSGSINASAATLAECNVKPDNSLFPTITTIINVIIGVLGVVAVAVVVLGGVQYTLSTGEPAKLKKAKDTILYGIVGLVVAILAYAIVNFVISNAFQDSSTGGATPSATATPTPSAT
jgi:hypothetical protein